jgi:hypothetical protein
MTQELLDILANGMHASTIAPIKRVARRVAVVFIFHLFAGRIDTSYKKVGGFVLVRIDSGETQRDVYISRSSFQFQFNTQ